VKAYFQRSSGRSLLLAVICSIFLSACHDGHSDSDSGAVNNPPPPPAGGSTDVPPPPHPKTYTIGGAVSGLAPATQLTLQDNGGDPLVITSNGAFTFATAVTEGGGYAVSVGSQAAGQTCTVSDGAGSGIAADVTNVAVVCGVATHVISGTLTGLPTGAKIELVNNDGDPLTINADGTFTFATPVVDLAGFAVRVSRRPLGAVCAVSNGAGTSVTGDITGISVACTAVRGFAYVSNFSGSAAGSVSQFSIGSSGNLVAMATPSLNTGSTSGLVVDPTGRYVYVANRGTKMVDFLAIGAADGALTPITDSATGKTSAATGTIPESVTIDPAGKYVYVPNQSPGSVSQFTVQANGALTPMATASVPTRLGSISIAIDPASKYAYVANEFDNTISQFAIGSDGALSPIVGSGGVSNVPNGGSPVAVAVDHSGKYLYVANYGAGSVSEYTIGSDGSLSPIMSGGVPAVVLAGTNPNSLVVDPTGQYVYVANSGGSGHTVSQYSIDANSGVLTKMADTVTPNATSPFFIAFDSADQNAYVISGSVLLQFTVGSGGSLTSTGAPVTAGINPQVIAITR
jgi:6-phosphogluconolactonase (cycloisomerase 2 family)